MREIRSPHGDLVQVCAHRGIFTANGIPENSLPAIAATAKAGIELVELDIKVTKNGVPILMHDPGVQRTTDFDFKLSKTPLVSQLYWPKPGGLFPKGYLLRGVHLRHNISRNSPKPVLGSVSPDFLPSLENALTFIRSQKLSLVVVLDLKDIAALKACLPVVNKYKNGYGNPFINSVIFKFDGKDLPTGNDYNAIKSATGGHDFHFMLRFNTTSILDKTPPRTIYAAHRNNSHFMGIEAVSKARPLALDNVIRAAGIDNHAIWNYYPLPELSGKRYFWFGPNSPLGDGTYRSQNIIDGDNAAFARASVAIREDRDHREDHRPNDGTAIPFLIDQARASGLTYDDPVALAGKLRKRNERNEARYISGDVQPRVAATAPAAIADGVYTLANGASDQQLALSGATIRTAGATLQPALPQQWRVTTTGGGYFTLTNQQTGQRLVPVGEGLALVPAHERDSAQLWTARPGAEGYVSLRSARSNQFLSADAAGQPLVQPGGDAPERVQLWRLTLVGAPSSQAAAKPAGAAPTAPAAGAGLRLALFPNPASNSFTVRCQSSQNAAAHLMLRNLSGQLVAEREMTLQPGENELSWETSHLAAGYYVLGLTVGPKQYVQKVLIAP